jgi:UPF0716 family protein affecting phage T7 exclusion
MKRMGIGVAWAIGFFVAATFLLGFAAGFQAGFKNPNDSKAAQKAGEEAVEKLMDKYGVGIFVGSCVCAAVLAGAGVLPGTQRPEAIAQADPSWTPESR